jgi:hypothetical protein
MGKRVQCRRKPTITDSYIGIIFLRSVSYIQRRTVAFRSIPDETSCKRSKARLTIGLSRAYNLLKENYLAATVEAGFATIRTALSTIPYNNWS